MIKNVQSILIFCLLGILVGCNSSSNYNLESGLNKDDQTVTLCLQVSINDATGSHYSSTRAEEEVGNPEKNTQFVGPYNNFEKIHTLRVLIVRPDNTVEINSLNTLPDLQSVSDFQELKYTVSTSQGYLDEADYKIKEKKRIYLIANEASIQPESLRERITSLKEGGQYENLYNGAIITKWIMENSWDSYAVPMINNDVADNQKKFVPMSEFFDVVVEGNLKKKSEKPLQIEKLFVTRTLVKFEFSVEGSVSERFKITQIQFDKLGQKEYLFPYLTEYSPLKNQPLGVQDEGRIITRYQTPQNDGNPVKDYIFKPENFGFTSEISTEKDLVSTYNPQLYFCETTNLNGDKDGNQIYKILISAELTDSENQTHQMVFPLKELPNLNKLPRNTVVKIHLVFKERNLDCNVTVIPYTGVNLNPVFGINRD